MPAMPRPNKKCQKILEKILGKPDNQQSNAKVYVTERPADGLNRSLDQWYNHKV